MLRLGRSLVLLLLLLLTGPLPSQLQAPNVAAGAASGDSSSSSSSSSGLRGLARATSALAKSAASRNIGDSGSSTSGSFGSRTGDRGLAGTTDNLTSGSRSVSSSSSSSSATKSTSSRLRSGSSSSSSSATSGLGSTTASTATASTAAASSTSGTSVGAGTGTGNANVGTDSIGGGASSRLCADTAFLIGERRIRSFTDLSRLFAHYTPLPKFGGRHIVAVDVVTPRPCGPFLRNATFYMRVGVRDTKIFKQMFQAQVLRVVRSLFKGSTEPRRILDLGARTGMSTAYLALHFPDAQIIATEPSLPEFALLRLNTARYRNVRTEYGAVWDSMATLKLGRTLGTGRHPGSSSGQQSSVSQPALWKRFMVDVMEVAGGGRLGDMVPAITIPDLLQRHNWPEVDLLVADFDGADKVVLGDPGAQAWLKGVKCVSLRLTPDQSPAAILKLLGSDFARAGKVLDQYFWCRAKMLSGEGGAGLGRGV